MTHINQFSTDLKTIARTNRVYVTCLNAFPDPVGGVITLTNNVNYIFTKSFDLGNLRFLVPTGGQVEFNGSSELFDPITSTLSTGALFSGDFERLTIRELSFININPTSTAAFWGIASDVSVSPAILFRRCIIINFAKIGTIEGTFYIGDNLIYINCKEGLFLTNPNNKRAAVLIEDQQHDTQKGVHVSIFDKQNFLSIQNLTGEPEAGDSLIHLDQSITLPSPANVPDGGTGLITNCGFSDVGGGTFLTATSIKQTDNRFIFRDNYRAIDSNTVGSLGFTGGTTETVVNDTSTFVVIAGTYTAGDAERFIIMDERLICNSLIPVKVSLESHVNLQLRPDIEADIIQISPHLNGIEVVSSRKQQQMAAIMQGEDTVVISSPFSTTDIITMEFGDILDIRGRNTTNPTNFIATDVQIKVNK